MTHAAQLYFPRATGRAGGLGYLNAFSVIAATIADLSLIDDADAAGLPPGYNALATGAGALVIGPGTTKQPWFLDTTSTAPANGTTIVNSLSSGGGAGPGRWVLATAQAAASTQAAIIWRPSFVSAGNVVGTFAEVIAAAALANGDIQIAVDDSLAPAIIAAAEAINLHFLGGFVSGTGKVVTITLLPGGFIDNVGYLSSIRITQLVAVLGAYPLTFTEAATGVFSTVRAFNCAFLPAPGSVAGGIINVVGAQNLTIYAEECSFNGVGTEPTASYAVVADGTSTVNILATSISSFSANALRPNAAGATINVDFDASCVVPAATGRFPGVLAYVMIDIANEVLFDDTSTVAAPNGGQPSLITGGVTGGKSVQQALQFLKPFDLDFDNTNPNFDPLTSILTVNHGLGQQYVYVIVVDDTNKSVGPVPITYVSPSQLTIDFTGFTISTPPASWHVVVRI